METSAVVIAKGIPHLETRTKQTHGKKDITEIHQGMYQCSNPGKVTNIARTHQSDGDDMVTEHLPVIFPSLFGEDDVDLMKPESELSKVIEFRQAWYRVVWVCTP